MATVEAIAPSGFTLTLRLYSLGSDTEVVNVAMTEANNRKGTYTATVNGQSGNFHATVDQAGSLIGNGYLWLQDDSGTYGTVDERDKVAMGEPGQELPPLSIPMWRKVAYLYKVFRNRLVTDTGSGEVRFYADDDVTLDHKTAVSDNAGLKIRGKWQSGP